jgi:hypothetical protein
MKEPLTTFDYMKLLLLNVIVALVIALAAVGFVYADGVDDPNFYKDFNPNDPNPPAKYNKIAPPGWRVKQYHYGNVHPIPNVDCSYTRKGCNQANIPEPSELLLLSAGIAGLCAWRKIKNKKLD